MSASEPPEDDSFPMVPSHPGWEDRPRRTVRLFRVATVLFAVLAGLSALVAAVRMLG